MMIWILLLLSTSCAFVPLNDIVLRKHLLDKLPDEVASISSSLSSTSEKPVDSEEPDAIIDNKQKPEEEIGLGKIVDETTGSEEAPDEETFAVGPKRRDQKEGTSISSSSTTSSTSTSTKDPEISNFNTTSSTDTTTTTTTNMVIDKTTTPGKPESKCEDKFPRCQGFKKLCANKRYFSIMANACAKTCGFCKDDESFISRPTACYDKTPEECAAYGDTNFCHAYFFREPEKVSNCQKTCGLC